MIPKEEWLPVGKRVVVGSKHAKLNGYESIVGSEAIILKRISGSGSWYNLTGAHDDGIQYTVRIIDKLNNWHIRHADALPLEQNNKVMKHLLDKEY